MVHSMWVSLFCWKDLRAINIVDIFVIKNNFKNIKKTLDTLFEYHMKVYVWR